MYISQLTNRWQQMAHFFKGETEKNFSPEDVGRIKGNNEEWVVPYGAGILDLGNLS